MQLRDYQQEICDKAVGVLRRAKWCYLAMEVRTGKTLTSLSIARDVGANNVLFITKKKAIASIEADFEMLGAGYNLMVINYESLHKLPDVAWDFIVCDESHTLGAFPKPSKRARQVKDLIGRNRPYVVLMSGTPTPESYSAMYHQVYGIPGNPFSFFKTFYKFANEFVLVRQQRRGLHMVNDYSSGKQTILDVVKPYTLMYTQKEAGFVVETTEHVLEVEMDDATMRMIRKLKNDKVVQGKEEVILADTAVKLMQKVHQLCSGTIKFESGNSMVLDYSKAMFIRERFSDKKIGIFYKFKEELNALKEAYGTDLTTELSAFETTQKSIALQIVSGREGISLRQADALVYYNIDFSATSYWQSRDRMTTKDRLKNDVYWVFSKGGIEKEIYQAVARKKDYTLKHFKKDNEL
jgi:SNF2 family DNA or RNA helicase